MTRKTSTVLPILTIFAVMAIFYSVIPVPVLAILDEEIGSMIRTNIKDAMMAIQGGNATSAQQPLMQANQSLSNLIMTSNQ